MFVAPVMPWIIESVMYQLSVAKITAMADNPEVQASELQENTDDGTGGDSSAEACSARIAASQSPMRKNLFGVFALCYAGGILYYSIERAIALESAPMTARIVVSS